MIKWLIQDVGINYGQLKRVTDALSELGEYFAPIGVVFGSDEISNLENVLDDDCKYVLLGGTKLLILLTSINELSTLNANLSEEQLANADKHLEALKAGIFYDIDSFDQAVYGKMDLPLLNSDAEYLAISEYAEMVFDEDKFIKPSRDLKAFNGGIIEAGTTISDYIESGKYQKMYKGESAVISPVKKINAEYRFFIVDEEVVAGSRYFTTEEQSVIEEKNYNVPDEVLECAKEYAKLYQPNVIFGMDIADTDDGYKIIEYNCWNVCGSYECDLVKTFDAVRKKVNGK